MPELLTSGSCRDRPLSEDYYANATDYCRSTTLMELLSSRGKRSYREIPVRTSFWDCQPGREVLFDNQGNCENSDDYRAPVQGKDDTGHCTLHPWCSILHLLVDMTRTFGAILLIFVSWFLWRRSYG